MAYPNRFRSARMTDTTIVKNVDDRVGELEQTACDALGININEDFAAKVVLSAAEKGVAGGVAELDAAGLVPLARLPFVGAKMQVGAAQGALPNGTRKEIAGCTTDWSVGLTVNPEGSRIIVAAGEAGKYRATAALMWLCTASAGIATLELWRNFDTPFGPRAGVFASTLGVPLLIGPPALYSFQHLTCGEIDLEEGEWVSMVLSPEQFLPATLSVNPTQLSFLAVERIG